VGYVYEEVGLYEDAAREYERVLKLDPWFGEAYLSLSRLYGEKLEFKDYPKAVEYLQSYSGLLTPTQSDQVQAVYQKMQEYDVKYQEQIKVMQEELESQTQEASESGDNKI
jgi:tetratricopeptide (TPR) repeat protein